MRKKRIAVARRPATATSVADDDFPPLTAAEIAKLRPVPLVKKVRWKLGLSQADFAKRYRIPLGTLRDWEQHRSAPDQANQSYLKVIAAEPERAAKVHEKASRQRSLERA